MDQIKVKEELSVEFVLILPNKENQFDLTKVKSENVENSNRAADKFACEICDKEFANKKLLWQHRKSHEPKVECKICHKSLTVLSMTSHMKIHELKTQPNQFKCEKCEKTFLTKHGLNQHEKAHENPFECDKCGKGFSWKQQMKQHLQIHLNVKAFQCNICDVKYSSNHSLQTHLRIKHGIGNKEFKCSECSFKSANYMEVKLHRSKVHQNLHCKVCGQTFQNKTKFNDHMKGHENFDVDDGDLKCKICQIKFENFEDFRSILKDHMKSNRETLNAKFVRKSSAQFRF
jgi:uncharacterized Zn-finger protein